MSFSTKGSAASPEVDKVVEATRIAKELAPQYNIDGELQFDAAFSEVVAKQKAPGSTVAGQAKSSYSLKSNQEISATKLHNVSVVSKQ